MIVFVNDEREFGRRIDAVEQLLKNGTIVIIDPIEPKGVRKTEDQNAGLIPNASHSGNPGSEGLFAEALAERGP